MASNIDLTKEISDLELEKFESLSARFSRTADIMTQKVLRSFFIFISDDISTFIDLANKSEKLNLIPKSETLIEIRDLRHRIAHEYEEENLLIIFNELKILTKELIGISENLPAIIDKLIKNKGCM